MALPILITVVMTLFVFQNCADPLDLADKDSLKFADTLPFAFDANVDHISYMSCSNMPADYNHRAFFSFRAGAFNKAGLRFNDEFSSQTGKYKDSEKASFAQQSEASQEASLQLSIRRRTNYQGPLVANEVPKELHDYETMLAPLDSTRILQKLSELGPTERVNYFSGISGLDNRQLVGSLRFLETEALAMDVRSKLVNTTLLALTYTDQRAEDDVAARGKKVYSETEVYGRGYELDFKLDTRSSPGIRRSLSRITEIDLSTRRTIPSTWECPSALSFLIVRPEDVVAVNTAPVPAGKFPCALAVESGAPSEQYLDTWKAVRNVLRLEDWYVDLVNRCVVPRQNGMCYGNEDNLTINYLGACDSKGNNCPHFVSVCVRTTGD